MREAKIGFKIALGLCSIIAGILIMAIPGPFWESLATAQICATMFIVGGLIILGQ
jgi:hypothetical protein